MLAECVQAYLPLDEEQTREYEQLIATEKYQGVQTMNTTWFDKGIQQGIQQGMEQGREQERRAVLLEQLEEKFGPLSAGVREKVQQMPPERLTSLTKAVLRAQSLQELGLES